MYDQIWTLTAFGPVCRRQLSGSGLEMVSRDSKVVLEDIRSIILQEMQMIFSEICLKISSMEAAVKAQMVSEVMVFTEAVSMTMDPDLVASEDLAVTGQQA